MVVARRMAAAGGCGGDGDGGGGGGGGQPIDSQSINTSAYTVFGTGHLFISLIYRKLSATATITVGTTEDRMRQSITARK